MMDPLVAVAGIILLGVGAQFIAARLRLPSILLLLLAGFLAGPATGLLDPDALLGDLLRPLIGLGVAIILFEGGLGLRVKDLRAHGDVVFRLITVGVLVTWLVAALAAWKLLGLPLALSFLLGAILVVSGPTVVLPLLRHVHADRTPAAVLRWEGILIDPIGVVLAALVFEFVSHGGGIAAIAVTVLEVLAVGAGLGLLGAGALVLAERRFWVPDFLASAVSLALVVGVFTLAEQLQAEAGLFAVTAMGVLLANQPWVSVRHLVDFKEDLSLLLLGGLFVLLAARLPPDALAVVDVPAVLFLCVLVLVARPLAVLASAAGSSLRWRERAFVAWMAPRGIVAAAVAAFFALRLAEDGVAGADRFVPLTFFVIIGTVTLYGLTARPVARLLRVAQPEPAGVLLIGSNVLTRAFAGALAADKIRAVIVDTDTQSLTAARVEGHEAVRANVASVHLTDDVDLSGIGMLWALTPSHDTNSLAAIHFADEFGRAGVFQIATGEEDIDHRHLRGRMLFGDLTYKAIRDRLGGKEWTVRRTPITERFTFEDYERLYGDDAMPLWVVHDGRADPVTKDHLPDATPGRILVSLVRVDEQRDGAARAAAEAAARKGGDETAAAAAAGGLARGTHAT